MRWYRRRTGENYYEHHPLTALKLGRPLPPGEIDHHRNRHRNDNHPDNLKVLPNQGIHTLLHPLANREARGQTPLFDRAALLRA